MDGYFSVAKDSDIPVGSTRAYEIKHQRIVVAHTDEGFYAVADECTHDSAPFGDGRLKGNILMCQRHGARFDVRTGEVMAPPAIVPLDTFDVRVENGHILIKID